MLSFSQRIGKKPIKTELEKEGLSDDLRNSLWSVVLKGILADHEGMPKTSFFEHFWLFFFKRPIDNLPMSYGTADFKALKIVRDWYYDAEWNEVFDFIEFCVNYNDKLEKTCNFFLKQELSAYRFIDGKLVEINSKEEIIEIENAIQNADKFQPVKEHLKTAIELYADRKKPDYRNSIKESISAVESLAKIIVGNEKTTLGQALKEIENKHKIPGGLKSAFSSLYGYTSDEGGIRHGLLESDVKIEMEEARFMMVACSAFVNYLISKEA